MLACARIGAVHSVVFGGFAANELASRIDDARPKVVVSASCGIEPGRVVAYKPLLDGAIDLVEVKPHRCIILQRPQLEAELRPGRDIAWEDAVADAEPADCVAVRGHRPALHPLHVRHDRPAQGHRARQRRSRRGAEVVDANIYDVDPGEVYWAASDVGWVVGHSYIVYAPAAARLHDSALRGQAGRDAGRGRVLARDLRARRQHDVHRTDRLPGDTPAGPRRRAHHALRPGPASVPCSWPASAATPRRFTGPSSSSSVPVIDHWWQTETGWAIAANCLGIERLPVVAGSPTRPVPGWDLRGARTRRPRGPGRANRCAGGQAADAARCHADAVERRGALPPTYLSTFPGYYETARCGLHRRGRLRLRDGADRRHHQRRRSPPLDRGDRGGTGAASRRGRVRGDRCRRPTQRAVARRAAGAEGGSRPPAQEIVTEAIQMVRDQIGPVAAFKTAAVVHRLPKTRSGKILRGTMRKIADQEQYTAPPLSTTPPSSSRSARRCMTSGTRKPRARQQGGPARSAPDCEETELPALQHEPVPAMAPERFASVLSTGEYEALLDLVSHATRELHGRVIWNVNSTAKGGGVAEMLTPLLGYSRGGGVDARWVVIGGDPEFFGVTKRIHNHLHGFDGDGGELRRRGPRGLRPHPQGRCRGAGLDGQRQRHRDPPRPPDGRPDPGGQAHQRDGHLALPHRPGPAQRSRPPSLGLPAPLRPTGRRLRASRGWPTRGRGWTRGGSA